MEQIELLGAPFAGQPDDDGDGDNELGDTLGHSSGQPASLLGSAARVPVNLVWKQRGHAVVLSMSSCGAIRGEGYNFLSLLVQFLITRILLYSVLYFAVFWKVPKIRCILPYFESVEFGQI